MWVQVDVKSQMELIKKTRLSYFGAAFTRMQFVKVKVEYKK